MFAQAFQVLGTNYTIRQNRAITYWDIVKHLASAFRCSAVDLPVLDVIEEVVFESVTTEALRGWTDSPAVLAFTVPPRNVEPVLSCFSHIVLKLLKFLFIHHLASIGVSYDTVK